MNLVQRLLVIAAFAAISVPAFAQSVVGSWKGRITVDNSKMQKITDPKMQQAITKGIAQSKSILITLTMRANKTYTATSSGGPNTNGPDTGTWSQNGTSVTLTSSKKDSAGKAHPQTFKLSPNGKTMTLALPPIMGASAKVTFSR